MSFQLSPRRLAMLFTSLVGPWLAYGVHQDADWYWEKDLNGLLSAHLFLHGCALFFAGIAVLWALPIPGSLGKGLKGLLPAALLLGLLSVPVPFLMGMLALFAWMTNTPADSIGRDVSLLLHPLAYGLVLHDWLQTKGERKSAGLKERCFGLIRLLVPLLLLFGLQRIAWQAESRLFRAISKPDEHVLLATRYRPFKRLLNLDPLLMRYLRESDYLRKRNVPTEIPPTRPMTHRIGEAWKVLYDEDISERSVQRYILLLQSKGYDTSDSPSVRGES